ncbi:tropomyosin-like [Clytia hemisphaerica]|uniref:Uncharacterized protein n=1 Tax=Clytia hemisphaerica TaxID=252671 RepID=A0A7M5VF68_9CNID|eukprot:TCONS_00009276-protein
MELVKERLNQMKDDYETSNDKIIKFESELQESRRNLESAVNEKESLLRRIEVVESQIINANKNRERIVDDLRYLERNTDINEGKRKFLENKELEGDINICRLEERLSEVRDKFFENSIKCEEGERRLAVLRSDFDKLRSRRLEMQEHAVYLQRDLDEKTLKSREMEDHLANNGAKEYDDEANLRIVEDLHREELDREERARLRVQKLQRVIEMVEDQIEEVRRRKKKLQVEYKNSLDIIVN